ncbi:hypothetical protein [Cysteiniphilum sp. JM-1]|uniref:hypothetical protein n=1 Tax=Cysteiniphilum sp. JM-1 TaxID=2610891 RepID=UPI001248709E|nr:hypothetical protein [Cysteiniphilum sp. JM-1]
MLILCCGICFADDTKGSSDLIAVLQHLKQEIGYIVGFIQVLAGGTGIWFVLSGLHLIRKHHTSQGAQGEHVKNGSGHLIIGVLLICIVPCVNLLQNSLLGNAKLDIQNYTNQSTNTPVNPQ